MRTWPRPSGLTLTACAALVTPSALTPARAAYSDFCLNVFIVGDDSFELPFKVITSEPTAGLMLLQPFLVIQNNSAAGRSDLWKICNVANWLQWPDEAIFSPFEYPGFGFGHRQAFRSE